MDQRAAFRIVTAGVAKAWDRRRGGILQVWLQPVLTAQLSSLRMRLLTGLAVEAAESLVGVLLVLQTRPELSEGQIFALVAGPLSRWRLGSAAS